MYVAEAYPGLTSQRVVFCMVTENMNGAQFIPIFKWMLIGVLDEYIYPTHVSEGQRLNGPSNQLLTCGNSS